MALSVCAVMCAEGARVPARPRTKGAGEGLRWGGEEGLQAAPTALLLLRL